MALYIVIKIRQVGLCPKRVVNFMTVTDFINRLVQVLREDLERLAVSVWDAGLMEPVG